MTTGTTFKEAPMAGSVPAMTSITLLASVVRYENVFLSIYIEIYRILSDS